MLLVTLQPNTHTHTHTHTVEKPSHKRNERNTNYFVTKKKKTFIKFASNLNLLWVFLKCDQICWLKNIHTAKEFFFFFKKVVWNITCFIHPLDLSQTLQWESLKSSALIWKSILLTWTSQESHLEPFQSSNMSQEQMYKQLFLSIKNMAQLRHCHSQKKMQTITCCREKIGEDGQESTRNHPKSSLR